MKLQAKLRMSSQRSWSKALSEAKKWVLKGANKASCEAKEWAFKEANKASYEAKKGVWAKLANFAALDFSNNYFKLIQNDRLRFFWGGEARHFCVYKSRPS